MMGPFIVTWPSVVWLGLVALAAFAGALTGTTVGL